ncbi:unnamed protein product [Arabidopsis lyrata]|uniref:cullin-2 n=1 Tax=Arabidopsis lyrata subsp. lyrata TaxID=81972 RepID=UPI000A29B5EC|nr:cullin-2 [Arabidopsis lyrata subsp. lyrata]XP_020891252.1 cullin-2 [Arabidopsis lyrata subsp. lyrata]CAH8257352.1 unnamed protein product [Arabidopsis lyrata]|eukprot:XP_020891250.1 cullin-2 [Arabidopsis lyrata subsp. lyrata]
MMVLLRSLLLLLRISPSTRYFIAESCSRSIEKSHFIMAKKEIALEQGWSVMEIGVAKLQRILEEKPEPPFESVQYMNLYRTIYNMCVQEPPNDYSQQLYDMYRGVIDDYNKQTVLPAIRNKDGEYMLRVLVKRWCRKFTYM